MFYYFEALELKQFVVRLVDTFPGSKLLFDTYSPIGVRVANKKVVESSGLDEKSRLKWGAVDKKDLLTLDPRIKIIEAYYYFRTLRFGLRNCLMGLLPDYLGIQYMIHLGLGEVTFLSAWFCSCKR